MYKTCFLRNIAVWLEIALLYGYDFNSTEPTAMTTVWTMSAHRYDTCDRNDSTRLVNNNNYDLPDY